MAGLFKGVNDWLFGVSGETKPQSSQRQEQIQQQTQQPSPKKNESKVSRSSLFKPKTTKGRASEIKDVDSALKKMNANRQDYKTKGTQGEKACIPIVMQHINMSQGGQGYLYHSYQYRYVLGQHGNIPGNIKLQPDKTFYHIPGNTNTNDEIDLLYIGRYNIVAIEIKARGGNWVLNDQWCWQNSQPVDKSPLAQAEKHWRHLYHSIFDVLPDGDEYRIIPLVVFVDKAKVTDKRSKEMKQYVPIAILDTLAAKLRELDQPKSTRLDQALIMKALKNGGSGKLYKGSAF